MKVDEWYLVSGSDIPCADGLSIRQPTLREFKDQPGLLHQYYAYINIFSLTKKMLSDQLGIQLPVDAQDDMTVFDILMAITQLREQLLDALAFYIRDGVSYDEERHAFRTGKGVWIDGTNYDTVRGIILTSNCIDNSFESPPKFANERARKIYEKIQKGRETAVKTKKGGSNLGLPNVISKLSSKSSSYNLLNIWGLTIYQLYDQFNNVNRNSQIDIIGTRWAAWGKDDFDFAMWYKNENSSSSAT